MDPLKKAEGTVGALLVRFGFTKQKEGSVLELEREFLVYKALLYVDEVYRVSLKSGPRFEVSYIRYDKGYRNYMGAIL
jgi:hypothetical protein